MLATPAGSMTAVEPSGAVASEPPAPSGAALGPAPARASGGGGHRRGGGAIRLASTVLLIIGLALLADVLTVVVWQEPLSALYARIQQNHLAGQLTREENAAPTPDEARALERLRNDRQRIALLARQLKRTAPHGAGVGRLRIPTLGVSYLLVNGDDTASLKKGPGIYSQTPFPGAPGTTAVAGHRTTYLAPFRNVDRLRPGQTIRIQMPYGDFTYAVEKTRIVEPTDFSVIRPVGYQRLVLSACDPPFSAAKRIIIFARLVHRAVRGKAFAHTAAAGAPIGSSGPGVVALGLIAIGVLLLVPLVVFGVATRLVRRIRGR
jgi:sortase A